MLRAYLTQPVNAASLRAFRAVFGAVLGAAALRFVAKGWVTSQLTEPAYHFTYPYLEFVRPLPAPWMYAHFAVLAASGFALAVGYRARLAAAVLALGWGYVESIDRAAYLNHYYLACLLAALLVVAPAGRVATIPRWFLLALRLQVAVVYVFAGLAKLNADWLLRAQPLRIWLAAASGKLPLLEPWLGQPSCAFAASWLGAAFDLAIVPALLSRKTRAAALALAVVFHVSTGLLLPIGMFPWIMLASVTLLLDPSWPSAWVPAPELEHAPTSRVVPVIVAVHCAVQLLVPLHHHFLVRDSAWTNQGFDFAWKVMIAEKAGEVRFSARDRSTGASWPLETAQLTPLQQQALARDPRLIVAYARDLARTVRASTGRDVAIHAESFASLNGRPAQRLVAENVDLTADPLPADVVVALRP